MNAGLVPSVAPWIDVILCFALTRLASAVFPQRRAISNLEWNASSAYTEDGGNPLYRRGTSLVEGVGMPHAVLWNSHRCRQTGAASKAWIINKSWSSEGLLAMVLMEK
jgi:hypothetical protein